MPFAAKMTAVKRGRNLDDIAPALALLAEGAPATEAAIRLGVSAATILNWMDWAWKHRRETDRYLKKSYSHLTDEQITTLWQRIERRRAKRARRSDFRDILRRDQ